MLEWFHRPRRDRALRPADCPIMSAQLCWLQTPRVLFRPREKIKAATLSVKLRAVSFDSTAISIDSKLGPDEAFDDVTMGEYRAYVIGADGHIVFRVDLVVPDETTARTRAKQLVNGHAVELWQAATRIERFEPEQ